MKNEITVSDRIVAGAWAADLDGGRLTIYSRESGRWVFAGQGWWTGQVIDPASPIAISDADVLALEAAISAALAAADAPTEST